MSHVQRNKRIRHLRFILPALLIAAAIASYYFTRPNLNIVARDARRAVNVDGDAIAIARVREWLQLAPESVPAWQLLAEAAVRAKDPEIIEEALLKLEVLDPKAGLQFCVEHGSEQMKQYRAADAERFLRRALRISDQQPEPWRLLAQLLAIQGRPRETAECLMNLIRLNAFTEGDLLTLAWPNSAIGDRSKIDAILDADPENLVPTLSLVGDALNENRVSDAEAKLNLILERHPDCSRALAVLGLLLSQRDASEFLQWQTRASSFAAIEPESWTAMGIWLGKHNQPEAAARCIWQAVELDPRNQNAITELGYVLKSIGQPALSAEFLEWSRRQQEITEISRRMEEQRDSNRRLQLSEKLESVGRIWEAWAWLRLHEIDNPEATDVAANVVRLKRLLTADLPRTRPEQIPGRSFEWSTLAMPVWTESPGLTQQSSNPAPIAEFAFRDEAESRGINFHFSNGPSGQNTIVQTSGGGVAAIDFDQDNWCDLYLTQGGQNLTGGSSSELDAMFRNVRGVSFSNVTELAGITEDSFSQGVAAGDIDNDGFPEIYVANLGHNRLFQNHGDGTFSEITHQAGLNTPGWTTSCGIADLDRDSNPDIVSIRYAQGAEITSRTCIDELGRPGVCRPTLFPAESDVLAMSNGDGVFKELCPEAGLDIPDGRGFGLTIGHFNGDNLLDIFVANDQTANFLFLQEQSSAKPIHFTENAVESGVAFDRDGFPQACMGVASTDLNSDGLTDVFITNFANESNTLYESQPHGAYLDTTREARLRDASFLQLGFGTQFFDADSDGLQDLAVLNGHILNSPETGRPAAMKPQLFSGRPERGFEEISSGRPDDFFSSQRIGRGLCVLDWNRDGRQDLAASFLDGNAALITNHSNRTGHWLSIELRGVSSSRDAIGTRLELTLPGGEKRRMVLTAGDGFASSNERVLTVGLGADSHVESVRIEWPSGTVAKSGVLPADTRYTAVEGRTIFSGKND